MAELTTIARPYAQAVFRLAQDEGNLKGWSEMLVLAAQVAADSEMAALIDNPRVTREQLVDVFLAVCGDGLTETGKNLIRVLADNRRLHVLPEVAALYEVERAAAEGTVKAQVTSAKPLSDEQMQAITASLAKRLGRDVTLDCSVDESLIGGAVIRAGDVVIDGSVVARLDKLKHQLAR